MDWLKNWLIGKKTYLAAGGLALLGIWLVMHGFEEIGMYSILTGAAFGGLGDKANRHQAEILAAIEDAGRIRAVMKAGKPLAMSFAEFVGDGVKLGDALAAPDPVGPGALRRDSATNASGEKG